MTYNLLNTTRHGIIRCLALEADGVTTFMDVSSYVQRYETDHTDVLESHKLTLTLTNANGYFDTYGSTTAANVFVEGRIISLEIGFYDPSTETDYYYPIFFGSITETDWEYRRLSSDLFSVIVFDPMYPLLTKNVTTNPWYNQQANLIASDMLFQYAKSANTNLFPLDYVVPFVQFPGMSVADAFADIFNLVLYFVWFNYTGALATRPRVGSAASGAPALVGWPDATSPPDDSLVSFVFPDGTITMTIRPSNRIFTFNNQVTVLGQSLNEVITYGPPQLLTSLGNANTLNSISTGKGASYLVPLTQNSQSQNLLTATGVYAVVYCPNFHNSSGGDVSGSPDNLKTLCADPTAITPDGTPVPMGPWESNGHNNDTGPYPGVIATDDNGHDMGMLFLLVAALSPATGLTVWQDLPFFGYANSDNNGWDFDIDIYGQPVASTNATLTKITDYNSISFSLATAIDVFGDHRTYQVLNPEDSTSLQPLGMGTPVEVYVNLSSLPSPTTLSSNVSPVATTIPPTPQTIQVVSASGYTTPGSPPSIATMNVIAIGTGKTREYAIIRKITGTTFALQNSLQYSHLAGEEVTPMTLVISADGLYISQLAQIAYEQGQIVFYDMTYKDYGSDNPPPVILSLTSQPSGGVDLAWTVDAHGATSYSLYRGLTSGGETLLVSGLTGTAYSDTGLINGTPYYYYIVPYYGAIAGTASNEVEGIPDAPAFPNNQPPGYTSSGGTSKTVEEAGYPDGETFDLTYLTVPAPQEIFQTSRYTTTNATGDSFTYTIGGLQFGRGYTVILSYGDPTIVPPNTIPPAAPNLPTSGPGFRVFNIIFNNGFIDENFDTWANANGSLVASTKTYEGIGCDASGNIIITFQNVSPPSGTPSGQQYGNAMISAIEVYDPQGIEATGAVINCGDTEITPTPPTVDVTGAYSPNQLLYGIKNEEINNPLLGTLDQCTETGQWFMNMNAWQRNPVYQKTASIPIIEPGQIIKYFNPRVGVQGSDQWSYVQRIVRVGERQDVKTATMYDEYTGFLLFSQERGGFTQQQLNSKPLALWPLSDAVNDETAQNLIIGSTYTGAYTGVVISGSSLCADQPFGMQSGSSTTPGIQTTVQPESLPQFTIEFLCNLPSIDNGLGFAGTTTQWSSLTSGIMFNCNTDTANAIYGVPTELIIGMAFTGGTYTTSYTPRPFNTLAHIVMTWDGVNLAVYLNGVLIQSFIPSGTPLVGSNLFSLGYVQGSGGGYPTADGFTDSQYNNLAIYNYPLSAGAILNHYNAIAVT